MNITTIGGGNGQSYFLRSLATMQETYKHMQINAIVSMSDDGRTTGKLMRVFQKYLGIHLPPPGDLRRPLYVLSQSENTSLLEASMEEVITSSKALSEIKISQYFDDLKGITPEKREHVYKKYAEILEEIIPISEEKVDGYKRGNLLMAGLFLITKDLDLTMSIMQDILDVHGSVLPVTQDKALIQAIVANGELISTQDRISNQIESYTGPIIKLELTPESVMAKINPKIKSICSESDYIFITPGDIYTSIATNFLIPGMKEWISAHTATLVLILNPTNKGGEAANLSANECVIILETYVGRKFDVIIANNTHHSTCGFENDMSIKGGDYMYLSDAMRSTLIIRGTQIIERDLIEKDIMSYRFSNEKLQNALMELFDSKRTNTHQI